MARDLVVFISPEHVKGVGEHSFPQLGILSLASYVEKNTTLSAAYIDETVSGRGATEEFLRNNAGRIHAVGVSLIASNVDRGLQICDAVKAFDPNILTIAGNDAFTATPQRILAQHSSLDCGFSGNEVYGPLAAFLQYPNGNRHDIPGLVWREKGEIIVNPGKPEPIFTEVDYKLLDGTFSHSAYYAGNLQRKFQGYAHRISRPGVKLRGATVEIARGCIKFKSRTCSFCSIHADTAGVDAVRDAAQAWAAIKRAHDAGFNLQFITADELPLTFPGLMLSMAKSPPTWWQELPQEQRPVLMGYARADGLRKGNIVRAMRDIGFRALFVGIDAGTPTSLLAMDKPLGRQTMQRAEGLFQQNLAALQHMSNNGMLLIAGFVLGHIGMTKPMLCENVSHISQLLDKGRDVIADLGIMPLSPEPGSRDWAYLTNPALATAAAANLGVHIAPAAEREKIAASYIGTNGTAYRRRHDYASALMPGVTQRDLKVARRQVVVQARSLGISCV